MKNEVNRALVAKKKFYLLTILCALLGISQVWALDERTKVNVDGTWYSLYSTDEYSSEHVYPVVPPTTENVSFEWRKSQSGVWGSYNGFQLYVSYTNDGTNYTGDTKVVGSTIYEKYADYKPETYKIDGSQNAVSVKFYYGTSTRTNYYQKVKIPMANHIRLQDGTSAGTTSANATLESAAFGSTSAAYHINLRSFLMEGTQIRYVSDNAEFHFGENVTSKTFDVLANSCAFAGGTADCATNNTALGNPDNYEVDVYFTPASNKKGSSSANITIYDGETARATVSLTAKVIPTYFFKATAAFHGVESADVKASFDKNVFEGVSATGSAVAANADAESTTTTAYYSAPASVGDYTFKGWFDNEECTGESLSASVVYAATITSTSISEENPTETKLYAKYTEVREARFFGDDENDVKVDSVYTVEYLSTYPDVASTDNTTSFWYEILNNTPAAELNKEGSSHPNEIITYDPEKREVIARNEGTATIVFHQEAVPSFEMEAVQKSYTFTVTKRTPEFSWKTLAANYNTTTESFFASSNTDFGFDTESSDSVAAIVENGTLTVYNKKIESVTITANQKENYKWEGKNEVKEIALSHPANHVPFLFTEAMKNDASITTIQDGLTTSWDDNSHMKLEGSWNNWDDKYVIIKIQGYPDSLKFVHRTNDAASSWADWYIQASINNVNWPDTNVWSTTRNASGWSDTIRLKLDPATRYIKLCYTGNYSGYFKDVKVTELKQFDAEDVNFGDIEINSEVAEKTLTFKHANAGYNVSVDFDEAGETKFFTIDHLTVANTGGDKCDEENFKVTFNPSVLGEHTATVTFSDLLGNEKVVTLSANVIKITPTVTAPEAKELTYSGAEQDLVDAATTDGGTLLYRIGEGEWSAAVPQATNAGEYVVWYKVEGNEIYDDVAEASVNVTIAKATPVIESAPQATDIKLGQTLADSYLDNGEASVNGTFAWQDNTIKPDSTGNKKYNVVFTPNNIENYNPVIIEVEVRVTDQETAVFNTESGLKATKILRDGQVLILRDGKVYNLNGMEVR